LFGADVLQSLSISLPQAVGFHYASSWMHKAEMALGLETDPADVMNEIFRTSFIEPPVQSCALLRPFAQASTHPKTVTARKGARISVVGVYIGYMNHLHFGAFMGEPWSGLGLCSIPALCV
jgi:hypothetical protein